MIGVTQRVARIGVVRNVYIVMAQLGVGSLLLEKLGMDIHIAVGLDGRLAANVCLNLRLDGRHGVGDADLDASAAGDRGGGIRLGAADGSDLEVAVDDRIDTLT